MLSAQHSCQIPAPILSHATLHRACPIQLDAERTSIDLHTVRHENMQGGGRGGGGADFSEKVMGHTLCAEHTALHPSETAVSEGDVRDHVIYVHDMPSHFTKDLTQLPVQWHPSQYDYDQVSNAPFTDHFCKTLQASAICHPCVIEWSCEGLCMAGSPHTGVASNASCAGCASVVSLASAAALPARVPLADRLRYPCRCFTSICCRARSGRRTLIRRSYSSSPSIWAATTTGSGSSGATLTMPGRSTRSVYPRTRL